MHDRDREVDAVQLRQRRGVEVLRVVAHREDRGAGVADPLALEEVRLDPRRVEHPRRPAASRRPCARARGRPRSGARGPAGRAACARPTRPIRPAPKMTTSSTRLRSTDMISLHSRAACGEPITMIRSPTWIASAPRGMTIASPRMIAATFESRGSGASRSGTPDHLASRPPRRRTRRSAPCRRRRRPSAARRGRRSSARSRARSRAPTRRSGRRRAAAPATRRGTPRPSCAATVFVSGESFFVNIAAIRFDLVARGAGDQQVGALDPALLEHAALGAVALDRRDVEAVGERREPRRVEVDDGRARARRGAPPRRSSPPGRRRRRRSSWGSAQPLTLESAGAAAQAPAAGPRARSRDAGAVRHRVRQRRLLDLLRARRHGRLRARADAARLHRSPA